MNRIDFAEFVRNFPRYPNDWPDGVLVFWMPDVGRWVPAFDVNAAELLGDFHGKETA